MIEVIVAAKERVAESIYRFELIRADGYDLPAFDPGAHIDVHLPNGLVRQYSLYNHPAETLHYKIAVLNDPASRGGSQTLCEQVQMGDRLPISEPRNLFPLTNKAKRSLLLAGGIGITPIYSMAQALAGAGEDFELHYCARSRNRMAFAELLERSAFARQVHFHITDGDPGKRIDTDRVLANPTPGTHLYVCGPAGFLDHILQRAAANGWPAEQVHREYFTAAELSHEGDCSFEIEIKSTGEVIEVAAGSSALHALEEAGIYVPVACEEGICGTCVTRVLAGEPDHRDQFMSEEERSLNDQFTPCCSRAKSKRLVLDL
jgi:vanillate O-demethylase ferredoxin subunit